MRKSRFWIALTVALLALTLLCVGGALAEKTEFADYPGTYWELDANGVLTISGTGPVYIYNYEKAPWKTKTSVKKVVFEEGITEIGYSFLYGHTKLTSVEFPSTLTAIHDSAFSGCTALTSISIPDSVISMDGWIFNGCTKLAAVKWPATVLTVPNYMFSGTAISDLSFLPAKIQSIGSSAFSNCSNLTSIQLPDTLDSIGEYAFSSCSNLKTVKLPNTMIDIPNYAFAWDNALTNLELPNALEDIGQYAFSGCSKLKLTLPATVTNIGNGAFDGAVVFTDKDSQLARMLSESGCSFRDPNYQFNMKYDDNVDLHVCAPVDTDITTVVIPDGVAYIDADTFSSCSSLSSVTFPSEGLISIGSWAFSNCSKLTELEIPATVTTIGESSPFDWNIKLYTTIGSEIAKTLGKRGYPFREKGSNVGLQYLYSEDGKEKGLAAVSADSGSTAIEIPKGVEIINGSAFSGCSKLTSAVIPSTVTEIDGGAFSGCEKLVSIALPTSVKKIGEWAFNWQLQNVFYAGTENDRKGINFGDNNENLTAAMWHYGESAPADLVNVWDVEYAWDYNKGKVTATATCKNNHEHVITETVNCWYNWDEEKGQKAPTCTEGGKCDYWSDGFTNRCFTQQEQKDVEIPALGHDYTVSNNNQPKYSWAIDNSEAYASLQCCRCWDEKANLIETAIPTVQVAGGTKTYTATFTDPRFETQTKEVVAGRDRTPPQLKKVTLESKELSKPGILYVTLDFVEEESGLVDCYINTCEVGKTNSSGGGGNSWYDNPQFTGSVTLEVPINTKFPAGNHYISYISLTDSQENRISYQVDTWYYSPTGEYNMDELVARDEGGTYAIIARVPINNGFTVSEDSISDFEYLVTAPSLIGEIENIPQGGHGVILFNYNQHTAPAELFDAMKGKDATFTFSNNDLQWQWKGTDLTKASKDVDLWVDSWTESGEPYGLTDDVLVIRFADNGELPGPVKMRIKSDYYFKIHGLSGAAYLYFQDGENIYNESSGVTAVLDKNDHWCEFTVSHNSTFIIAPQPIKEAKNETCAITFDANGGSGTMDAVTVNKGELYTLPACGFTAPEGKEFDGWDLGAAGDQIEITADTVLTAQWKNKAAKIYKVTFKANGGKGTMKALKAESGKKVKLTANKFTKKGYVFAGWNTKKNGKGTAYKDGAKITLKKNITLYAQWDKIALKMDKVSAIKQGKDLKLSVTLKIGGKAVKGKKVTFTFNGKKYTAKTDKKGVAKVTIKKAVTKKLKVGKKVKISAAFGGVTVNATAVVKK